MSVPCKHCASISLAILLRPGTQFVVCGKCSQPHVVTVEKSGPGWQIAVSSPANPSGDDDE